MSKIKYYVSYHVRFILLCLTVMETLGDLEKRKLSTPEIVIGQLCIITENGKFCSEHDTVSERDATYAEITNFEKDRIFTFRNNTISVAFQCRAAYPVTWTYTLDRYADRNSSRVRERLDKQDIQYTRKASNISDPTTFLYSSWMTIRYQFYKDEFKYLGQHVCQWMEKPNDNIASSQKLKLFEEKETPINPFPLFGENITIWMKERADGSILIPCFVSNPNVTVTLSQLDASGVWSTVQLEDGVEFFPELGFLLDSKTSAKVLTPGPYNCTSRDTTMLVTLTSGTRPEPAAFIHQEIHSTAMFSVVVNHTNIRRKVTKIKCCSNSTTAPGMSVQVCRSQAHCHNLLRYIPKLVSFILELSGIIIGFHIFSSLSRNSFWYLEPAMELFSNF